MSRERPSAPPRAVPDAQRGLKYETRAERRRLEREKMKAFSGPGFFGSLMARGGRRNVRAPRFIRMGSEAEIVENLQAFFSQRPRPWRQPHRQAGATFKERVKAQRRAAHAAANMRRSGAGILQPSGIVYFDEASEFTRAQADAALRYVKR